MRNVVVGRDTLRPLLCEIAQDVSHRLADTVPFSNLVHVAERREPPLLGVLGDFGYRDVLELDDGRLLAEESTIVASRAACASRAVRGTSSRESDWLEERQVPQWYHRRG